VVRLVLRACVLVVLLAAGTVSAQTPFSFVKWRSIGPVNTSGRIDDIAVARIRGEPDAIYIATASGGLWKSSNNGVSFAPVFDGVACVPEATLVAPNHPAVSISKLWKSASAARHSRASI